MPKWTVKVSTLIEQDGRIVIEANHLVLNRHGDLILSQDADGNDKVLVIKADHWLSAERAN